MHKNSRAQPGLQKGGWNFFARLPCDLMVKLLHQKSQFLMKVEIKKKTIEKIRENTIDCSNFASKLTCEYILYNYFCLFFANIFNFFSNFDYQICSFNLIKTFNLI